MESSAMTPFWREKLCPGTALIQCSLHLRLQRVPLLSALRSLRLAVLRKFQFLHLSTQKLQIRRILIQSLPLLIFVAYSEVSIANLGFQGEPAAMLSDFWQRAGLCP